jgi:hypothetical protein
VGVDIVGLAHDSMCSSRELRHLRKQRKKLKERLVIKGGVADESGELIRQEHLFQLKNPKVIDRLENLEEWEEPSGCGPEVEGSGQEDEGSGQEGQDGGSGQEDEGSGQEDEGSGREDEGSGKEDEDSEGMEVDGVKKRKKKSTGGRSKEYGFEEGTRPI